MSRSSRTEFIHGKINDQHLICFSIHLGFMALSRKLYQYKAIDNTMYSMSHKGKGISYCKPPKIYKKNILSDVLASVKQNKLVYIKIYLHFDDCWNGRDQICSILLRKATSLSFFFNVKDNVLGC